MPVWLLIGISVGWIPLAFLFDGVTVLMLPVRLGGSATDLGLVSFVGLAVGAAVQPVVGRLSDVTRNRVDRRLFTIAAGLPAIAGLWLLVGSSGIVPAVIGYVVVQGAASSFQAGQQTLIPEHAEAGARDRASGVKAVFDVGGAFVAFVILGALLAGGDLRAAAVVTTVILVVAAVLLMALVPARRRAAETVRPPLDLPRGLGALVAGRFLFLVGTYAVGRFLLLLVADRLSIPVDRAGDEAGGLLALLTLGTAAAALVVGRLADGTSRRELMAGGALVGAAGILVLVPAAGIAGLAAGGLLMSAGTGAFITANWAATVAIVPVADAGRLMGIANLGTALAAAVAGLAGPLIDVAGFAPALLAAAAVSAASVVVIRASAVPFARPAEAST
ncbi:MAG TPA: MFS transporter [Candidatus Limnocylindrales bacterium]|jgi:MFS family permease